MKRIIHTIAASLMMIAAIILPAFVVNISVSTQAAYAVNPVPPPTGNGEIDPLLLLTALMIMFLPLFGVPLLLKFSGGLLGRIGAFVNNPNKGPFDKMRKSAEGYSQYRQNKAKGRIFNGKAGRTQRGLGFAAYARRNQKKDRIRAGVEREANRAATAWTADKLKNDKKFREQAAGGEYMQGKRGTDGFESATARTRALGEAELDKLIGEETKAGIVTIRNMQFGNTGLGDLAATGTGLSQVGEARRSRGQSTQGHELTGDFYQKAALAMATSEARVPILERAVSNAHNMSEGVRETFSYQLGDSYATLKAKAHHLNDDEMKQHILTGRPVTPQLKQQASARALSSLTKTQFAPQEAVEYEHFISGFQSGNVTNDQLATTVQLAKETLADDNLKQFMNPNKLRALNYIANIPPPPAGARGGAPATPPGAGGILGAPVGPALPPPQPGQPGFIGPLPPPPAPGQPGFIGPLPPPTPGAAPGGGTPGAYATPPASPGGTWTNWTSAGTTSAAPVTPPAGSTPSGSTSSSSPSPAGPGTNWLRGGGAGPAPGSPAASAPSSPPSTPSGGSAPSPFPEPPVGGPSGPGNFTPPSTNRGLGWTPPQIQQPQSPEPDNNDDNNNDPNA